MTAGALAPGMEYPSAHQELRETGWGRLHRSSWRPKVSNGKGRDVRCRPGREASEGCPNGGASQPPQVLGNISRQSWQTPGLRPSLLSSLRGHALITLPLPS